MRPNRMIRKIGAKSAMLLAASVLLQGSQAWGVTGTELWNAYNANKENHPNIPNCSYAGYKRGEAALPSPGVVANVRTAGATGNGVTDDTAAFKAAINTAISAGGGAVLIPAGTYVISDILRIQNNNIVLRGEGRGTTILKFSKSLTDCIGALAFTSSSQWSWAGGLIWVGPSDTWDSAGRVANGTDTTGFPQRWEYWRPGAQLATVSGTATRGATSLTLSSTAGISAGQMVMMTWSLSDTTNFSFLKHVAGHSLMNSYAWSTATWIFPPSYNEFQWPVEIKSVSGNTVTLAQPLRVDIQSQWAVKVKALGPSVSGVGIERLKIQLKAPLTHTHLTNVGWNGMYFNRAFNCWAHDVEVQSAENPIILASAKQVTIDNVNVTGPESHHHSLACRVNSHDNLFQNFTINAADGNGAKVKHGINTEWFSAGNVWSKGTMNKGTFDSHRAMSFDSIRTEITTSNSADGPGGDGKAGPFLGRRMVHWNINVSPVGTLGGQFIFQPECLSMGALVGIRGVGVVTSTCGGMVAGDKGTVTADAGVVPNPANLYVSQLTTRLGVSAPTINISSPANGTTYSAPANITISASTSGVVNKVDFYAGTMLLGTDMSSPYSIAWSGVLSGRYPLTARATGSVGLSTTSGTVNVTVNNTYATSTTNIALNKTAIASSGANPHFVTDGNTGSNWASAPSDPQWIYVDLLSIKTIKRVKIIWENAGKDFQIQGSPDAVNWFTMTSVTGNAAGVNDLTNLAGSGRYVRMYGTARAGTAFSIHEFEIYEGTGTGGNVAPTVNITAPSNGATYTAPASITINANAADTAPGTVSSVQFLAGTTSLGTDTSSPYGITWSGVAAGAYSLTARATDNGGAVTTSGTVNVTVNGTTGGGTVLHRINAGGPAVSPFSADANFSGGTAASTTATIDLSGVTSPAPAAVYQTERYGNCTYTFGSLTANTSHTVRLHFAETWHNGAGSRKFDVSINGTQVLNDYDVFAAAGAKNKAVITQYTANANASGQIVIQFTTVVDNAKISGIEIIKN